MNLKIINYTSDFAENKDTAKDIRLTIIKPTLSNGKNIIIDFTGVNSTTQSFIHALIREVIKDFGIEILDRIKFKGCNDKIKKIISIVIQYIQDV